MFDVISGNAHRTLAHRHRATVLISLAGHAVLLIGLILPP